MADFQTNVSKQIQLVDSTQTTLQVFKKNKKEITPKEIKVLTKQILDKAPKGTKMRIRALGVDKFYTLKSLDGDLDVLEGEEYAQGKVKDTSKFSNFYQLELTVIKPITKIK